MRIELTERELEIVISAMVAEKHRSGITIWYRKEINDLYNKFIDFKYIKKL